MSHRDQVRREKPPTYRLKRGSAEVGKWSLTPRRQTHKHQEVLLMGWEQGLPRSLYTSKEGDWTSSDGHWLLFTEGHFMPHGSLFGKGIGKTEVMYRNRQHHAES